jgi:hypothetical protein
MAVRADLIKVDGLDQDPGTPYGPRTGLTISRVRAMRGDKRFAARAAIANPDSMAGSYGVNRIPSLVSIANTASPTAR